MTKPEYVFTRDFHDDNRDVLLNIFDVQLLTEIAASTSNIICGPNCSATISTLPSLQATQIWELPTLALALGRW